MISIERFTHLLDQASAALPRAIYRDLNLGIGVVDKARRTHRTRDGRPVYTLGEYHVHGIMGRGIVLYYGSFARVYPGLEDEQEALRIISGVLKHELTHHLESLAGDHTLEIADAAQQAADWPAEPH